MGLPPGGLPRGPSNLDLRTRRVMERLANTDWPVGTVTSVSLTMPAIFSVVGSPITAAGTFTVTLATETANKVFIGPASGGAAQPTFRALVAADLPALDLSTTLFTGVLPVAHGGTGLASMTPNVLLLGGTTSTNPLQQAANERYASGWLITLSNGQPVLANLNHLEFALSVQTATP